MTGLTTGAKNKMYVSATAPATFDQVGYEAITDWVLAPCPESLPEVVEEFEQVTFTCLHTGTTEVARGVRIPIPFAPPIRDEPANAAQIVMLAAKSATNGSDAELISVKLENEAATQAVYFQVKIFRWGRGERISTTVVMRIVNMIADAATLVEVNT